MKELKNPAVFHLVKKGAKAPTATGASRAELEAWAAEMDLEAGEYSILEISKPTYFNKPE